MLASFLHHLYCLNIIPFICVLYLMEGNGILNAIELEKDLIRTMIQTREEKGVIPSQLT